MHFADDKEKMIDFMNLTKEEFLKSYNYLTEKDYEDTIQCKEEYGYVCCTSCGICFDVDEVDYVELDGDYFCSEECAIHHGLAICDECGKALHCDDMYVCEDSLFGGYCKECYEKIFKEV